jgi:hypothetical protein
MRGAVNRRVRPRSDVRADTPLNRESRIVVFTRATDTEVNMLFAVAAILLILAVVGGVAIHPLLLLIAILAVLALVGALR